MAVKTSEMKKKYLHFFFRPKRCPVEGKGKCGCQLDSASRNGTLKRKEGEKNQITRISKIIFKMQEFVGTSVCLEVQRLSQYTVCTCVLDI